MCRSCFHEVVAAQSENLLACDTVARKQLIRNWFFCDVFMDCDDVVYPPRDSDVRLSASNMEYEIPVAGVLNQGLSCMVDWFVQVRRTIPDLSCIVHDVTFPEGQNSAQVSGTYSGTQLEKMLPLFPVGRYSEWKFVSSLTFNEDGLICKECVHVLLDPCPTLSPLVHDGFAQFAKFLAMNKPGSQLLEDAIERLGSVGILDELRGSVMEVAQSHHGNHPLQKYIVSMPPDAVQFIVDELRGQAVAAALHCTACRVVQRVLEHCTCTQIEPLVAELLGDVQTLMTNRYGNFVVQRLLEHGSAAAKWQVVNVICCSDVKQLARHWVASNVLRCAFVNGSAEDKVRLACAIAPDSLELTKLSHNRHGSFIAREIKMAKLARR